MAVKAGWRISHSTPPVFFLTISYSYPLHHLWPAKMAIWQSATEAWSRVHVPAPRGDTCAAGPQPSGRPCVGCDSEGHSRHQMGQDGVFRRNWRKLLTANTASSCGHASIPHICTAPPFSFLICLSGLSSTFRTREGSEEVFIFIWGQGGFTSIFGCQNEQECECWEWNYNSIY